MTTTAVEGPGTHRTDHWDRDSTPLYGRGGYSRGHSSVGHSNSHCNRGGDYGGSSNRGGGHSNSHRYGRDGGYSKDNSSADRADICHKTDSRLTWLVLTLYASQKHLQNL